jgi:hypothetical protein
MLVISSAKVGWAKQGTCILVDNEPKPPTDNDYASHKGWKEVKDFLAATKGGNFLFPKDQLMLVLESGAYKPIESEERRTLRNLKSDKNYLVWYHHLLQNEVWTNKKKKK